MERADTITVTFAENVENHRSNQQIGTISQAGFTYPELRDVHNKLTQHGFESHLINLGDYLPVEYGKYDAGFLVIHNGINAFIDPVDLLYDELKALDYDKYFLNYGKVNRKHARHNLCFADFDQTPNYEIGNGTVVDFKHLPHLSHIRQHLATLTNDKATNLFAEANHYYDVEKCYINFHPDLERKVVIGLRLGRSFPLYFNWYLDGKRIGPRIDFDLNHGDIYIMDEKACGNDGRKRKIPILRHAAGFERNIK